MTPQWDARLMEVFNEEWEKVQRHLCELFDAQPQQQERERMLSLTSRIINGTQRKERDMPFVDPIGLPITIDNAVDVSQRPETSRITSVQFTPQSVFIRHTGEASWPQIVPAGWEGPVQYTSWFVIWVDNAWYTTACIINWKTEPSDPVGGTWHGGGPAPFSHGQKDFWYQAPTMAKKQPHQGELIGVFVTAGGQRMMDECAPGFQDRSNIVWVNVPSADSGLYTFDSPDPVPPTPQPPSGLPAYNEDYSVQFGHGCNDVYTESGAAMDPGMISVHSMRAAFDYYTGVLSWDESYEKHINEFRAVYGLGPVA